MNELYSRIIELCNEKGITGFGREIEYLTTQKGYTLSADKTRLIKD